jgi:hypothetical protein
MKGPKEIIRGFVLIVFYQRVAAFREDVFKDGAKGLEVRLIITRLNLDLLRNQVLTFRTIVLSLLKKQICCCCCCF